MAVVFVPLDLLSLKSEEEEEAEVSRTQVVVAYPTSTTASHLSGC